MVTAVMDTTSCSVLVMACRPALVAVVMTIRQRGRCVRVRAPIRSVAGDCKHRQRGGLNRQPHNQQKEQESSRHSVSLQQAAIHPNAAEVRNCRASNEDKAKSVGSSSVGHGHCMVARCPPQDEINVSNLPTGACLGHGCDALAIIELCTGVRDLMRLPGGPSFDGTGARKTGDPSAGSSFTISRSEPPHSDLSVLRYGTGVRSA
jgi:hypothetical protein